MLPYCFMVQTINHQAANFHVKAKQVKDSKSYKRCCTKHKSEFLIQYDARPHKDDLYLVCLYHANDPKSPFNRFVKTKVSIQ